MNWEVNRKHLGEIKSGTKASFTFKYKGLQKIVKIGAGCSSCTKATLKEDVLHVTYTPGSFPKHLSLNGQKEQKVTKTVYVTYEDKSRETLYFTANVIK